MWGCCWSCSSMTASRSTTEHRGLKHPPEPPEASTRSGPCKKRSAGNTELLWAISSNFSSLFCCKQQWRFVITWSRDQGETFKSQDPAPLCELWSFQWIVPMTETAPQPASPELCSFKSSRGTCQHAHLPLLLAIHFIAVLFKWGALRLSTHDCSLLIFLSLTELHKPVFKKQARRCKLLLNSTFHRVIPLFAASFPT